MENVKIRALQRAGVDLSPPKPVVSPTYQANLLNGTLTSSAFTEVKQNRPSSRTSPSESTNFPSDVSITAPKELEKIERGNSQLPPKSVPPLPAPSMVSSLQSALDDSREDLSQLQEISSTIRGPLIQQTPPFVEVSISNKPGTTTLPLNSDIKRQSSTQDEMEKDNLNARDIFSRMGSLKEKIMQSSRNISDGDGEYRSRSNSNVSTQSRSEITTHSQFKKSISMHDSESEDDTGHDYLNSSTAGMGALERLKLKVANAKSGNP
jgi:hypothetical protein